MIGTLFDFLQKTASDGYVQNQPDAAQQTTDGATTAQTTTNPIEVVHDIDQAGAPVEGVDVEVVDADATDVLEVNGEIVDATAVDVSEG